MIRGTATYLRGGRSFPPSEGLVMAMMEWVPLMQPHGHTACVTLYCFQYNLTLLKMFYLPVQLRTVSTLVPPFPTHSLTRSYAISPFGHQRMAPLHYRFGI